jgi:hypothetical protein
MNSAAREAAMSEPVSPQTSAAIEAAIHIGEKLLASKRRLGSAVALLQSLEQSFAARIDDDVEISGADAVDYITRFITEDVRPFLATHASAAPEPTPEQYSALGASVDSVFGLRPDPNNRDRFRSNWGSKTTEGVGRSVLRLVAEWEIEVSP